VEAGQRQHVQEVAEQCRYRVAGQLEAEQLLLETEESAELPEHREVVEPLAVCEQVAMLRRYVVPDLVVAMQAVLLRLPVVVLDLVVEEVVFRRLQVVEAVLDLVVEALAVLLRLLLLLLLLPVVVLDLVVEEVVFRRLHVREQKE
jgi:hypothetical protein